MNVTSSGRPATGASRRAPASWRDASLYAIAVVAILVFGVYCATHAVDVPVYHRAARLVLNGDYELYPAGIYSNAPVTVHAFRYAPIVAFLFVPFALLPLQAA